MRRLDSVYLRKLLKALASSPGVHPRFSVDNTGLHWEDDAYFFELKLPLSFPSPEPGMLFSDYQKLVESGNFSYSIVLIRAGNASLGIFRGDELLAHKVIRKYMVRKKQGKMQISYLNQKGKSRAGSRVRLRESVEFFEEINSKLEAWFKDFGPQDKIFYSCSVRLKSPWFSSRISPPFTKNDPRLITIPQHIHQPTHEELLRIQSFLASGELVSYPT